MSLTIFNFDPQNSAFNNLEVNSLSLKTNFKENKIRSMDQVHVLIVEDDPIIGIDLADRINNMGFVALGPIDKGEQVEKFFTSEITPDVVIMDVMLAGDMNGIETSEMILQWKTIPIIFLTANSDDHTFTKAKKVKPFAFLTKPFRGKDLQHAIDLAMEKASSITQAQSNEEHDKKLIEHVLRDRIFLKHHDRMIRIFYHDILWIEADDYYCKIKTKEKEYHSSQSLKKLMDIVVQLPEFLRVHRSYIINLNQVSEIGDTFVIIENSKIPINRNSKEEILNQIQKI